MKKLILAAALLLSACKQGAADGYTFEPDSKKIGERDIEVVLYYHPSVLSASYETHTGARKLGDEDLMAFSVINSTTCTIHMMDPAIKYQPEFFGHELTHCLYGEFHPSQNER